MSSPYGNLSHDLSYIIGALIVKTIIVNFSYFEIFIGMGTLTRTLFNRRLRLLPLMKQFSGR